MVTPLPIETQRNSCHQSVFSVQKCDKAVQVSSGLGQGTIQRLENVFLGPYGGHFLLIADIFQSGHGSLTFERVLTFSLNENALN